MSAHGSSGAQPKGFQLPFFHEVDSLQHKLDGVHPDHKKIILTFVVINILFLIISPQQTFLNYELVFFIMPIWLPIYLYKGVHDRFGQMNFMKFLSEQENVLLEIRVPREVLKSPLAMETFFASMSITSGETTWYKRYVQGGRRPWWSFEIVSLGGRVHLYIWTRAGYRRLVEGFLYAQYPDIEIIEAEDYSRLVDPSHHGWGMFAGEYQMTKPDPYPIKTYVDYGMEAGDKPEESVDPLAQIIETIANIGPEEQFWIQIIMRASKNEKYEEGNLVNKDGKPWTWDMQVAEATDEIRSKTVKIIKRVDQATGAITETESFPNPSKGQSEGIAAIERKSNKPRFDVGIRTIYLAPDPAFQGIMIPAQINLFKAFNNVAGNGLGLASKWSGIFNDYPWEDPSGHHKEHLHHLAVQMYRRRAYFHDPYKGTWMMMSTEELATLFHIPSSTITTPSLQRIQSSTSAAPSNLPS
jgi:hypothetical protein